MEKQNWLQPVDVSDVEKFAHEVMNIAEITTLAVDVDETYGKLFRVGGFSNDEVLTSYGKTKKYIEPVGFGEFGAIDIDEFLEGSTNNFRKLFSGSEAEINVLLSWIAMVAAKNQGRTIDGKTYSESFAEGSKKFIELDKKVKMTKVENEANERTSCISALAKELAKTEAAPQKQ